MKTTVKRGTAAAATAIITLAFMIHGFGRQNPNMAKEGRGANWKEKEGKTSTLRRNF